MNFYFFTLRLKIFTQAIIITLHLGTTSLRQPIFLKKTRYISKSFPPTMQSFKVFIRRAFSSKMGAVQPQAFIRTIKPSTGPSQTPNTNASKIDKNESDPADKDTSSREPDLLWLHGIQDAGRRKSKGKYKYELFSPIMGTYSPWLKLPEGWVHIDRYFP